MGVRLQTKSTADKLWGPSTAKGAAAGGGGSVAGVLGGAPGAHPSARSHCACVCTHATGWLAPHTQVRRERARLGIGYKPLWFAQVDPSSLTHMVRVWGGGAGVLLRGRGTAPRALAAAQLHAWSVHCLWLAHACACVLPHVPFATQPNEKGTAWKFKADEYWQHREARDWACCPDLYSDMQGAGSPPPTGMSA